MYDDATVARYTFEALRFNPGLHTCFGQCIDAEQILRLVKAVLKCRGLERAAGRAGELRFDGPFPASLQVRFAG